MKADPRQGKHNKVHLLLISEKGRVRSRKISVRFVKWVLGIFLALFVVTSIFTALYLKDLKSHHARVSAMTGFQDEVDRLRSKVEEQAMEIRRLQGVVARLNRENQDLKQHIISRKAAAKKEVTPPVKPQAKGDLEAFQRFIYQVEHASAGSPAPFHIRDPRINVTANETVVTFKLFKDTLKKISGRFILVAIYRPEDPEEAGKVVAFPSKGVSSLKIRPYYGRFFRIEKLYLPVEVKLPHPEGVSRFSEFHIFVYGAKRKLLYHEQFKAP